MWMMIMTHTSSTHNGNNDELCENQSWGWDGFCDRKTNGFSCSKPRIRFKAGMTIQNCTFLHLFLMLLPSTLVKLLIEETSKTLHMNCCKPLTYGEFLRFLGIQLYKYVMKIMTTYGTLRPNANNDNQTYRILNDGSKVSFKYTKCFDNHYTFRHSVDDNNNLRHAIPSIEGSWVTHRWAPHVLSFLIALSETNAFLAFRYYIWDNKIRPAMSLNDFCRKLALQLIKNKWLKSEMECNGNEEEETMRQSLRQKRKMELTLLSAPLHASFFSGTKWTCNANLRYAQYTCKGIGCSKRIRTYCSCNPNQWLCTRCFSNHFKNCIIDDYAAA